MNPADSEGLSEFVTACRTLGASGDGLSFLEAYLDSPLDVQSESEMEVGREALQAIIDSLSRVENELPSVMNGIELGWFKLGYHLAQVSTLSLISLDGEAARSDEEYSIEGPLLALRSTVDLLDGPPSIISALNNLVERAGSGEDPTSFYRGCQSAAQAIYSLLDILVRQPNTREV